MGENQSPGVPRTPQRKALNIGATIRSSFTNTVCLEGASTVFWSHSALACQVASHDMARIGSRVTWPKRAKKKLVPPVNAKHFFKHHSMPKLAKTIDAIKVGK